jgi:hypothetical protein
MGKRSITLDLPDELYERIQEEAKASHRPVETVALETLGAAFRQPSDQNGADLDRLLAEMQEYSDSRLWAIVRRRLTWIQSLRLRELSAKGKQEALGADEELELNELLDLVDRQMLLRSEALLLLKRRGQDVESYLMVGT